MNLPNRLTVSRLGLTLAFLGALLSTARYPRYASSVALVLFCVASATDYYDGHFARRYKLITNFGIFMDPLADKILVCSAFIVFVDRDWMPSWMVVIIVARELAITGLRVLAASKQVVLAAEQHGKHKTVSQIILIIVILIQYSYPQWGGWAAPVFDPWIAPAVEAAKWVAVLLTCVSGAMYLWRNRQLYLSDL